MTKKISPAEQFKVTIKDRSTAAKATFYCYAAGVSTSLITDICGKETVKIILESPTRKKTDKDKKAT